MVEHIDHALVAKAHTSMYQCHKYWSRKPHNTVAEYIRCYSGPGEVVFDPFVGSGVTAAEALKAGRIVIANDLDPVARFITLMTVIPADLDELKQAFTTVRSKVEDPIRQMYVTRCENCGRDTELRCLHWEEGQPLRKCYSCTCAQENIVTDCSSFDHEIVASVNSLHIDAWHPRFRFPPGVTFDQARREAGETIADLYTHRNLRALALLWDAISGLSGNTSKELLKFTFSSILHLASKMMIVRSSRPCSSAWVMPSYWFPALSMESNVWFLFDNAFRGRQSVLDAKAESNQTIGDRFQQGKTFILLGEDATNLESLKDESVDYIFTDPPYGGSIQHLELNTIHGVWLFGSPEQQYSPPFEFEITINSEKNEDYYYKLLHASFKECFRVLKPARYLTVTFHSTQQKTFNINLLAAITAGFDLERILYQPPARPSTSGLLRPYGSAIGDYYIRFSKPLSAKRQLPESSVREQRYERVVVETTKRILAQRGQPTPYTFILNGIYPELDKHGVLFYGPGDILKVLKRHLGEEFALVETEVGGKPGKMWWLKDPSSIPYLDIIPLNERVERVVINVLNDRISATFDEILQEIFINFPNALTPDNISVLEILREYAQKTKARKWRLKPSVQQRENEHGQMIYFLAQIGKKLGFEIWIGLREQSDMYESRRLRELCDEALLQPEGIEEASVQRVRNIDVIWHTAGRVKAIFEVENTTGITEAIVRGAHIPYSVERFIVLPEEREGLFDRKAREPALKQRMSENGWRKLFYSKLEEFYEANKRRKRIARREFDSIVGKKAHVDESGQRYLL